MPSLREATVNGHSISYLTAGRGPALVLLHGITCSSDTWEQVIPQLARHFTVIAPDLLGHGRSDKPAGDYSVESYARSVRDLLLALGHTRATIVGHSLGGGVAMQLSCEFPEMVERLVLVASGGLGSELHPVLRMASLPGVEQLIPPLCSPRLGRLVDGGARLLERAGVRSGTDLREMWRGYKSLFESGARRAFFRTVRGAIGLRGQVATALDRLHLAARVPTLIVWGKRDTIIPVEHAYNGHEGIAGSRLAIFDEAGHFPHIDCGERFVRLLTEFVQATRPARVATVERIGATPASVELQAA
jgi:pimeloyl-ACP methyl ester carboxylesterase